jgi:hypothetical protein
MKRTAGFRWTAFARSVIDAYGGVCHICLLLHGGARQIDHVQPVTERPDLAYVLSNCRPAHGAPGNPCPQCSAAAGRKIHCNQLRGMGSIERARRIIAERIAEHAAAKSVAVRDPDPGRSW